MTQTMEPPSDANRRMPLPRSEDRSDRGLAGEADESRPANRYPRRERVASCYYFYACPDLMSNVSHRWFPCIARH